jgi:HEPN domain-containing protein
MDSKLNYLNWIKKAEDDFQFAKINLEEEKEFFDQICFHFQQAAEKYLKAFIVVNNLEFRKIHELPTLLDICFKHDPSFASFEEDCKELTEFYIEPRYPTLWEGKITKEMAWEALKKAKKLRDFIRKKLLK